MQFGKSLIASAAFVSNVFFSSQIDYFDVASEQKPLLHVWSLAVEEQFYIFWPLIVVALNKKAGEKGTLLFCVILSFTSLLYGEYLVHQAPTAAFYLLPARAWELALGALLAMFVNFGWFRQTPRYVADIASIVGIALICVAIFSFDEVMSFPGIAALVPCAGAALVIAAGESRTTLGGRLLSLPPFAFIGRMSYSLYLWHWPILVFSHIYLGRDLRLDEKCWALSLTALAAYLSWRFVEEPFRKIPVAVSDARAWVGGGAAAGFAFACTGALIVAYEGFPRRVQTDIREIARAREEAKGFQLSPCLMRGGALPPVEACLLGQTSPGQNYPVILWGDSHAAQLAPALEALGNRLNFTAKQITKAGCGPVSGVRFFPENNVFLRECAEFNKAAMQAILKHSPAIIILAGRWDAYATGKFLISEGSSQPSLAESLNTFISTLRNTILALTEVGHRVVIIGQAPAPNGDPVDCIERTLMTGRHSSECAASSASRAELESRVNQLLQSAVGTLSDVRMVFPFERLCYAWECRLFTEQSDFVYMDASHLSAAGAKLLSAGIEASITSLRRRTQAAARNSNRDEF
jgi:hypothetical protein